MNQEPNEKSLIAALNQNWQHVRHIENERLQFTYIYVILVAGILAFLEKFGFSGHIYLILFLVMFSFLGLIVTLKIGLEFDNHISRIKEIVKKLHLDEFMGLPTSYSGIGKIIRVKNAFIGFYVIMFLMWLYLLITTVNNNNGVIIK